MRHIDLLLGHCADGEDRDDGQDHREDVGPCRGAGEDVEGREIDERCAVVLFNILVHVS